MPFVNFDDPAYWATMYDPPFARINKDAIMGAGNADARNLRLALEAKGMTAQNAVALLGGGYGWVAEEFISAGYANVIVCDTSAYIQGNKNVNAVVEIFNEGATTSNSKRTIRQLLGRGQGSTKIDWAITEDLLPCFTDAEILQYAPNLREIATNVAHWVTPLSPGNFMLMNWKTIEDWKALLPSDWIVRRGGNIAV